MCLELEHSPCTTSLIAPLNASAILRAFLSTWPPLKELKHRRPKLSLWRVIVFFIFKCLCERWARETSYRDTVTAVIYCYITTLRGTWLWTFSMWRCYVTTVWIYKGCMGENVKSHFSRNFDIFSIKNDLPQCLVVFSIILPHFSTIRSLLSELSHFEFPLLRKSKGWTLHSGLTPAQSETKNTRSMPAAPIPPQNYSTGSSAPFQLNSKPNSSPQRTLQSCKSKKASHQGWGIMLLGPTADTFEARADCRANKLTLTSESERTVQDRPCTLLHGPKGRFLIGLS